MEISITYPHDLKDGSPQTMIYNLDAEDFDAVRLHFNPSGDSRVTQLKLVAALLHNMNSATQKLKPEGAREAAVAKTHLQTTSMWGVLAATKGL